MTRWLAVTLGIAALCSPSAAALGREPALRSASASRGHVKVVVWLGDLAAPAEIEVATRSARRASGSFVPANVKLRERITATADPVTDVLHWRTRRALDAGTYYVVVSAVASDLTSCTPHYVRCAERWSNVLRVVLPKRRA